MNGRVYDPNLGRFLSVDPVFEFPTNTQSLNPYSYVLNNPLSLTDPTGYAASDASGDCGPVGSKCSGTDVSSGLKPGQSLSMTNSKTGVTATATMLKDGSFAISVKSSNGGSSSQGSSDAQDKPSGHADIASPAQVSKNQKQADPPAWTISNKVYTNRFYRGRLSDDGTSLTATIPFYAKKGVSEADIKSFEKSVKNNLVGTWASKDKPDLHLNISVLRLATPSGASLYLLHCPSCVGHGDDGTAYPGDYKINVGHFGVSTDGAHELLHTFGLWHQHNSTHSIMSWDLKHRKVLYSDAKRLIDAYKGW